MMLWERKPNCTRTCLFFFSSEILDLNFSRQKSTSINVTVYNTTEIVVIYVHEFLYKTVLPKFIAQTKLS